MIDSVAYSPEQHIKKIREEFGISEIAQIRGSRISRNLHKAIEHLSEDLYSKDIHFVLEIIQNAEDNHYTVLEPGLTFQFLDDQDALLIVNNETGFRPEDVEAICAVGATTKDKRQGYIGEKGIGFKSTFLVSSEPHIFSGGYSFKFQEKPDPIAGFGYIVPYWISELPPMVRAIQGKTCILLPLKAGKRVIVESQLGMISPETILFLKKLKRLDIQFSQSDITKVVRRDQDKPLIKLVKNDIEEMYWLTEAEFDVPENVIEEKRSGIFSRTVSIALPLEKSEDSKETVFAYLPTSLRSGLGFLVNADFILSSNRESVKENLSWNLWLRDCIAPTFIRTFEKLIRTQSYRFRSYTYIPLKEEIADPFFLPVAESIQEELENKEIIWTWNGKKLTLPSASRFASMALRELFNGSPLPKQLSETHLVHKALEEENIAKRLRAIGVKPFSWQEILACLQDVAWLDTKKPQWFIELYSFLSGQSWATKERLKEVSILLKEGGGWANGQREWIYFPTLEALSLAKKYQGVLDYLHIDFLDRKIYNRIKDDAKLIFWLGNTLEIEELNLQNLCKQLITSLSRDIQNLKGSDLIRCTKFLRDNFDELTDNVKTFMKDNLPLLVGDSQIIPARKWGRENPLVIPEVLDTLTGWQNVFPEPEDREHMLVLSSAYLDGEQEHKKSRQQWLKFFLALGATEAPWPRKKNWEFNYSFPSDVPVHLQQTITRHYSKYRYELFDWSAPGWIKQPPKTFGKGPRALIAWLRKQDSTSEWKKARFRWFYYSWQANEYESEYAHLLKNVAWFPTTKGYKRPFEVFLDKPEIREFFGNTLAYARYDVSDRVAEFLGVRTSATLDQVLSLLYELASRPARDANARLISRIYAFLSERWKPDLRQAFSDKPLILSTRPKPAWVTLSQAIWPDRYDVFGDAYVYLAPQYENLGDFFINKLGIARDVSEKEYAQAWLNWAKTTNEVPEKIEAALERIYPILLKVAKEPTRPAWWDEFVKETRVWTQTDRFVDGSAVFIPDDGELRSVLDKEHVEFAWRPPKDSFTDYFALYQALGVRLLTNSVHITAELVGKQVAAKTSENKLLTDAAKLALCYYLRNEVRNQYEQLQNNGVIECLLCTQEEKAENLRITYSVDGKTAVVSDGIAYWSQEDRILLLSTQHEEDEWETEVSAMISRHLVGPQSAKDLENFIGRILGSSEKKIAGIIKKKNWTLPDDEKERALQNLHCVMEIESERGDEARENETHPDRPPYSGEEILDGERPKPKAPTTTSGGNVGQEPSVSGKDTTRKARPEEWRPRLRSYVEHTQSGESTTSSGKAGSQTKERDEIELAGINAAVEYESRFGRYAYVLPHTHEGWDINVFPHKVNDDVGMSGTGAIRRVEVKATKYSWDGWGVGLTAAEFREARRFGDDYYLYVVEFALDPAHISRDPYIIRNPAALITEYRFDEEWKKLALGNSPIVQAHEMQDDD